MYSIFNPRGEKIADCGILQDAVNLVNMRDTIWDGHYYQFKPDYQTIDMEPFPQNQLSPNQKYIGWEEKSEKEFDELFPPLKQKQLPNTQQEPLDL